MTTADESNVTVPESIVRLVRTFVDHREHYTSASYNETQLRREFLDPFFQSLGWDIDNYSGYAAQYKDVVHEDTLKIAGTTKAPDYSFRIGGTRKFFVEAKRPNIDIRADEQPAFQLRRYAWSAKLPVSILTNFGEFAVYDTRVQPARADRASAARTFYCTFDEYETRWAEIAAVFSREAVLKGAFDKYAESAKKRKGTAEVDEAFLVELERWRELLARNFALRNPHLTVRDLNFAVQVTIDRIVFLRMCEDRGTEDYGRLQTLRGGTDVYVRLCELFMQADKRYNSGLFHFSHEKDNADPDTLTLRLALDDKALKDILRNLYYPDSPYEFSVLPADILGHVYERFLGKTITLTAAHHAHIEEKAEVRKAGGVYYTPTFVVRYIISRTLGPLLETLGAGCKPVTLAQAAAIKILDPACGSGSFVIEAYQYLLDWHLARYIENPKSFASAKIPTIYRARGGEYRLTTMERKRILLNNIHGVDIDRQAVEVTKLSLLLKVLEGETEQITQRDWIKERERILPDLDNNIRCGNSLIAPDFYADEQMLLLDEEQQYRINVFDWDRSFAGVMRTGGFHCVVGNPPYGATLDSEQKSYLSRHYVCQSYQLDSYLLFLERTVSKLLRLGGKAGFIIPNPWLTNLMQDATRRFVVNSASIEQIVHFTFPVFKSATVDTEIVILSTPQQNANNVAIALSPGVDSSGRLRLEPVAIHEQREWVAEDGGVINIFLSPEEKALFRKIQKMGRSLDTWFRINVGVKPYQKGKGNPPQTSDDVRRRPFDATERLDPTYRELLRGSDINRYAIVPVELRFISYGPWLAEPRPAAGFDVSEKLLVRQTGDRPIAALDVEQRLAMNNLHVLAPIETAAPINIRFFLAVLNSRMMTWFYRCLNPEAGEALAEVKRGNVAVLPVPVLRLEDADDAAMHERLVVLVNQMLSLQIGLSSERNPDQRRHLQTIADATDVQIDRAVYELYGLTQAEIEIVELKQRK